MKSEVETDQLNLWRSDFGRQYTDRNDVDRPERVGVWKQILDGVNVGNILEVGCNIGWNLEYLRRLGYTDTVGLEPQTYPVERIRERSPQQKVHIGSAFALPFKDGEFDLVFTSGVLIHINGVDLPRALDEMYRVSRRLILAIEYDNPVEEEVPYRGHNSALWKRDHGAAWLRRHPSLREIRTGRLGDDVGYADSTYHLMEKS